MNILEIEDTLKGIPDEALMREAQTPSGDTPQYLVISEVQRRSDMRERYAAGQEQPQATISDQIVNKGIMTLGGQPSPSSAMAGQQPMPQQDMTQQPMLQQAMPQQPVAPPQMMNVGGEVELGEGDDISMLLEELGGVSNKIPDNRERDLYTAEFEDSVLSGFPSSMNAGQASIPNAILEDARKFNPDQMLGVDPEELSVLQGAEADLPEVLGYAGGGIVELQEGGPTEDDPNIWEKGWEYAKENPLDVISTAAMAIPVGGWAGAAGLKGLGLAYKALRGSERGARWLNKLKGARPHSLYSRPNPNASSASRGFGHDEVLGGRAIANPRVFSPQRVGGTIFGAGLLGSQFTGDDAEADGTGINDPALSEGGDNGGGGYQDLSQADQGPEPGSLEWIKQEQLKMYQSGGGAREEKLQEVLSRQREQGTLMQEQAKSDMVTSALMNLGAGIAAGDPSEGLRLAANAVEGIRSSARQGIRAQQNMMDELELTGIDANQAEQVATLASMADIERLEQQRAQLNNSAVDNAFKVIQARADALSQLAIQGGEAITRVDISGRIARAFQKALADPYDQNAYLSELLSENPAGESEFSVSEG